MGGDVTRPTCRFDRFSQLLKCFGTIFGPLDCVRCTLFPVCHMPYMHRALANSPLRAGCQCSARCVCAARPSVCVALTETFSPSLKFSQYQLHLCKCNSPSHARAQCHLIWVKTSIYRVGGDGFDFFFLVNPFSNVCVLHFFLNL